MLSYNKNMALVIGHPGHELRIFRFLELYKPRVYILTDGSGYSGASRVPNSLKIIENCGATLSPVKGYFSDKEMYRIILEKDHAELIVLMEIILKDFEENKIEIVFGDAIEGFNPTHDLCRYILNIVVAIFEKKVNRDISNYDFLLDRMITAEESKDAIAVSLTDEDFKRKYQAASNYTELAGELQHALEKYGPELFKTEYLRKVIKSSPHNQWQNDIPYYEEYARSKIKNGVYKEVITFEEHVLPLINLLSAHFGNLPN
jgi:hypothetical protein